MGSIVEALLDHGANVNGAPSSLNSPLVMAARFGNVDCVMILLSNKANTEAKNEVRCLMDSHEISTPAIRAPSDLTESLHAWDTGRGHGFTCGGWSWTLHVCR